MNRSLPLVAALAFLGCASMQPRPQADCPVITDQNAGERLSSARTRAQQQADEAFFTDLAPLDVTKTYGPAQVIFLRRPAVAAVACR